MVFSCIQCRTIVGDSFSFVKSDETTNTITLSAVCNIISAKSIRNTTKPNLRSVCCKNCSQNLGQITKVNKSKSNEYTLDIPALSSYELGNNLAPDPESEEEGNGVEEGSDMNLTEEVIKMQTVFCDFEERLRKVEKRLACEEHLQNKSINDNTTDRTDSFRQQKKRKK